VIFWSSEAIGHAATEFAADTEHDENDCKNLVTLRRTDPWGIVGETLSEPERRSEPHSLVRHRVAPPTRYDFVSVALTHVHRGERKRNYRPNV
jgi:hypothetical protein